MDDNCFAESKNIKIPIDQIEQNKKPQKKRKRKKRSSSYINARSMTRNTQDEQQQ